MKIRLLAGMLVMPLAMSCAHAQDNGALRISGFGTGALTWTNTDDAEFARPNQAHGARKQPITGVDSNLGLQADYAINRWLSLTGQGLVRKDAEEGFGADLTWAFVKARLSDDVSIRVGRVGLPIFMISDYRNVGYVHTFVRPPVEMYSQVPFEFVDGADITWRHNHGGTTYSAQLAVGRNKTRIYGGPMMEARDLVALNLVAEHGPLTVRFGHADNKVTLRDLELLDTFVSTLRTVGAAYRMPQLVTLADDIAVDHKHSTFTSVGAILDWNDLMVQAEYAKRKSDSYLNDTSSWYVTAGYRVGNVTPYFTHARLSIDDAIRNTVPTSCPAGYPAACAATMAALSSAVSTIKYSGLSQGEQRTHTLGVRWDFRPSMALKVQVDRVRPSAGHGLMIYASNGFSRPVTVGAVALDVVF